jgi:hypothetical protein
MKKALILSVLAAAAVSPMANATAVCAGDAPGVSKSVSANSLFVLVGFATQCSSNVFSNYTETPTAFGVVAGSKKGKNFFGGSTNGGGVRQVGPCAATGCSTTEITDGASADFAS